MIHHDLTMLHHISNCLVIAEKSQVIVDGQNAQVFGVPPPMVSRALAELSSGMGHLVANYSNLRSPQKVAK